MILLKCKDISKKINKREILKNVNLNMKEGDVVGLIGPNGAGKTTLIKCIVGLQKIDSGSIMINGFNLRKDYEASIARIGAIIENPDFYNYMSGFDNLKLKGRLYNVSNKKILELISIVGLTDRMNEKVSTYSLGMKQRLGIANALINNPNILILDEPTNGLDPSGIIFLKKIIKELSDKGIAILISSHILSEIESICNKIVIIKDGIIIDNTNINQIKYKDNSFLFEVSNTNDINISFKNEIIDYSHIKVYCNKEFIPLVIESLIKSNIRVYSVKEYNMSLEKLFIEKIGDESNV